MAYWNENGEIHISDLTKEYEKLENNISSKKREKAKEIVFHSDCEGFALNWNSKKIGQLATGNGKGNIEIFENDENYTTWKKMLQYSYHKGSVEDIVFSPSEPTVFASCNC